MKSRAKKRRRRKQRSAGRARTKAGRGSASAGPSGASKADSENIPPKPKRKLPDAFRTMGLDEYAIASEFATQVKQIKTGKRSKVPRKLLLDYLKECVRILYAPARRGDIPERPPTIELVHFVPRPDRSGNEPPPATGS